MSEQHPDPVFQPSLIVKYQRDNPFKKLNAIVYEILENAIIACRIPPGTKISSTQIAEQLNVSRTPVEEAIYHLKERGLLCAREGKKGLYTPSSTDKLLDISLDNLFEARIAIECTAAYRCAQYNFDVDLDKMRMLANMYYVSFKKGYFTQYALIDNNFHKLIIQSCGNPALERMFNTIEKQNKYYAIRSQDYLQKLAGETSLKVVSRQHMNIYQAIESGMPEMAEHAMKEHLNSGLMMCMRYRDVDYSAWKGE